MDVAIHYFRLHKNIQPQGGDLQLDINFNRFILIFHNFHSNTINIWGSCGEVCDVLVFYEKLRIFS